MKRSANLAFVLLLLLSDSLMIAAAFYLAYWLRFTLALPPPLSIIPFGEFGSMLVVQIVTMLIVYFFSRLYDLKSPLSRLDELYKVFAATSIGMVSSIAASSFLLRYSTSELSFSRAMIVYAWLLTVVLVMVGRTAVALLRTRSRFRASLANRLLIVGTGEVGRMILQKARQTPRMNYQVVGFVNGECQPGQSIMGVPVLGSVEDLPRLIEEHYVVEVIVGLPELTHQEALTIISRCERGRVGIKIFPDLFQIIASELSIGDLGGLPLLSVRDVALRGWKLSLKRAVDLVGSAFALVLLSPVLMLVAIIIKLESPGPVFYAQERMGLDARPFWCLKFRSMAQDAEKNGPGWTSQNDPRRTRFGALLRRLSIDELPQLINVLIGDMSLVGPRPERPVYVEQFRRSIPRYMDRHREKAGLTGWAQVNGLRGDTSIAERTKIDLWYIENWSLWLDFKILLRTAMNLFRDRHAY
jgi:Undecaprenyl-phosphate glucose phosphotransferase